MHANLFYEIDTISILDETEIVAIVIDDVLVEEIIIVIVVKFNFVAIVLWLVFIRYCIGVLPIRIIFLIDIVHWKGMVMNFGS